MFTAVEHAFVSFLVPPWRICVCVFGRGLLATCHPPLTLAIEGIHYFHLQGIPSSFQVGHTSTAMPPGECGQSITRLNQRRENQVLHRLPTTAESTAMKMSSTTVLSVAALRLRRVASVVMTLTPDGQSFNCAPSGSL